jgi:hypothetical protein
MPDVWGSRSPLALSILVPIPLLLTTFRSFHDCGTPTERIFSFLGSFLRIYNFIQCDIGRQHDGEK